MKVKEIAQRYQIDELEFDRFLGTNNLPCRYTFSGTVVADENVEEYVRKYFEYEESLRKSSPVYAKYKEKEEQRAEKLQALFVIKGGRGKTLTVCKNKCIIKTHATLGNALAGNATDGEKVIFFKHCCGLQFKEYGLTIGYLQFETPSAQMNNLDSNFFSENTFTFDTSNGMSNAIMSDVYYYVMELIDNNNSGSDFEVPAYPPLLAEYLNP